MKWVTNGGAGSEEGGVEVSLAVNVSVNVHLDMLALCPGCGGGGALAGCRPLLVTL